MTWVSVSLKASTNGQAAGNWVTLTATANADITNTPYDLWVSDQTTQQNVGACTYGSSCAVPVTESAAGTHTFIAYVAKPGGTYPPPGIAATSSTLPIYWVSWGVDSSWSPITSDMLSSVTSAVGKPDFWGRYIGQTGNAPDMTASEATLAHQNGIKILPIFSEYTQGQTSGYSTGVYFAKYAAVAANSLGIPGGTLIAIDIEHNSYVNAAFIQGWYDGMVAQNYVPAIYANPGDAYFPGAYCTAVANQPAIGTNLLLYSVEPSLSHLVRTSAYAWGPSGPGCANNTQLWQYNLSGGSNPNVDLDEALASAPLW